MNIGFGVEGVEFVLNMKYMIMTHSHVATYDNYRSGHCEPHSSYVEKQCLILDCNIMSR